MSKKFLHPLSKIVFSATIWMSLMGMTQSSHALYNFSCKEYNGRCNAQLEGKIDVNSDYKRNLLCGIFGMTEFKGKNETATKYAEAAEYCQKLWKEGNAEVLCPKMLVYMQEKNLCKQ